LNDRKLPGISSSSFNGDAITKEKKINAVENKVIKNSQLLSECMAEDQ
jgi:hypothetical protein